MPESYVQELNELPPDAAVAADHRNPRGTIGQTSWTRTDLLDGTRSSGMGHDRARSQTDHLTFHSVYVSAPSKGQTLCVYEAATETVGFQYSRFSTTLRPLPVLRLCTWEQPRPEASPGKFGAFVGE